MRRFLKDYELVTSVDEKGREKKAVAYKGSYFDFEIAEEDYQGFRKLAWALIVAMIALQIGAGFVANRGMYQIYIAVPYVLCFFPLVYLSAGALRLPKNTTHLQRDQAELTIRRMKRSGAALLVLNSMVIISELVYLVFLNQAAGIGRELAFLALAVPIGVINALLFWKTRLISVNPE